VLVKATFTLPGLAGLVLMLGMAVDANVLIYERLREERERGASLALAIRNGYDRAFPTIIDTHLSSIFTAVVLYIVGNDQLKGFGISLTVGLIISLFTSLYMTRLLFDFWLAKGWLHKLSMFRLLSKTNIDFMAIRYYWFTATIILTIVGGAIFVFRLDKGGLNIDFVGGTAYSAELVERVDTAKLRDLFAESRQDRLLKVADVQPVEEKDGKASKFKITYAKDGDLYTENETVFVELSESATKAQLEKRAGRLEDVSIEKIYVTTAEGGSRDYFTLRTAEKSPDLVQVMIDRLMVEKDDKGKRKDLLKKILLSDYQIDANSGKTAVLSFTDPSGAPEFASTAQMTRLLKRQIDSSYIADLKDKRDELDAKKVPAGTLEEQKKKDEIKKLETEINDLELINNQMTLKGIGPDEGGRFQWMELVLTRPLSKDVKDASSKLETVLGEAKKSFEKRRQPERLENFDSQLAQETQNRALIAIVASWAAILLYLWIRFGNWTFGMAAVLCLVHDLFFTLGIIAFCHWLHDIPFFGSVLGLRDFKIDLQTVAALLTLVGYSVSDTIVVFDRIREVRGKNPELTPKMINDSVNQTLSRTLLTATSVWLVVMVLYFLGGEGVHLFAFVMVVGVIVGTYSSIYIASPLLLIFGEGKRPAGARETVPAPTAV
jgi:SecD/SecF fusion protein